MTYKELDKFIAKIAEELGCPYSYYSSEWEDVVKAPYLLFDYPDRNDLKADNVNYVPIQAVRLEYDSRKRDLAAEFKIEKILSEAELSYSKEAQKIDGQNVFETLYEMEVTING